jgi:hypothetical protein
MIILLLVLALSLAGCGNDSTATSRRVAPAKAITKTPESTLLQEVGQGKLVAVYDKEMLISGDTPKDNFLIIKNAYDTEQTFNIAACEGCGLETSVTIPATDNQIIRFPVSGDGQKKITVKDSLNNFYGQAEFKVTSS